VLVACVISVASAAVASAATPGQSYGYQSDIGTSAGAASPVYNGVSVSNGSGNVFVVSQNDGTVGVFDASGTSVTQASVSGLFITSPSGVGATADGNSFYVVNQYDFFGGPTIEKFTSDGAPTPTYSQDAAWAPAPPLDVSQIRGLAVDPTSGDVYVSVGTVVKRLSAASGAVVSSFNGATTSLGKFTAQAPPRSLAVAPNGDVYVVVGTDRVEHLGSDGSSKGSLNVPVPDRAIAPSGIAVNSQNGDVAVELLQGGDTVIKVYTAANALKDTIRVPAALAADPSSWTFNNVGLAFAADGSKLYVAVNDGTVHVFGLGTRPGADAPTATQIVSDGAHLSADVATNGQSSTARMEYCLATDPCDKFLASVSSTPGDRDYDATLDPNSPSRNTSLPLDPWVRLPVHTGLSNPGNDTIADDVTGLPPNTRYLLKTYAINDASGAESFSSTSSFTTALPAPDVQTGAASNATTSTADVAGTINAFGGQTTYRFEYGLTTNYGSQVPANGQGVAGSARKPRGFIETIKGLQPGTAYHFRLVATNATGTTYGADGTFTTLGAEQVAPHRAYEQVTSPNKGSLAVFANWGFQASADGSGFVYSVSATGPEAASSSQASRYLAHREANNWKGQTALDPPLAPTRPILNAVTQAVSDDFQHALVISQKALTPDAVEGGANIYVNDVGTGNYHLIGTAPGSTAYSQMVGPNTLNTFIAGAQDFSWVVLVSRYPLVSGAPQVAMYKWTRTGGLSVLSRLPNGTFPTGETWYQSNVRTTNPLASADGNTVAFSLSDGEGGVYRRTGNTTTAVSVSHIGSPPPTSVEPGQVDGISRDGNFVVFHSPSQLTASATDPGPKMYRYDAGSGSLDYLGPQDGTGDGALDVPGIGDDGRTVYFNSNGQFVVWRDGQLNQVAPTSLRAATNASDNVDVNYGHPSPNGRYFAWVATDETVHVYDAVTNTQACLSCLPGGGATSAGRMGGLPDRNLSNRFPQVVTDDGHVFFDTSAALISSDHNGTSDVYEYYQGRVTLISPGDRDFTATLADITSDGRTVFFTTAEGLVGQDTDQSYDVYAARIGGGLAAQNPAPPDAPCAKADCAEPGPGPVASPPVGSLPQPQDKPAKRTNQVKVKVSLTRVSIGSKSMKITIHASQRGRLKVTGTRVVTTYRNITKEGTYSVSVPLSKKARSLLHAKKRFKVAVKVSLAGGWGTSSAKYSRTLNK
jgi:hypothetical protein